MAVRKSVEMVGNRWIHMGLKNKGLIKNKRGRTMMEDILRVVMGGTVIGGSKKLGLHRRFEKLPNRGGDLRLATKKISLIEKLISSVSLKNISVFNS